MKYDFITIFKTFDQKEKGNFERYIQHFYGEQKTIIDVFNIINQSKDIEAFKINDSMSSKKNMLNALSDLKQWAIEFLTWQEMKNKNSIDAKFVTIEALQKKGLDKFTSQKMDELNNTLKKITHPNMWHFLPRLRLAHINYFNTEIDKFQEDNSSLTDMMDILDNFYISAKLKYSSELISRERILQEEFKTKRLLTPVTDSAKNDTTLNAIIKQFYYPKFKITQDTSEADYQILKSFITETDHDPTERLSGLLYLLNFAVRQINKGDKKYFQEYFELVEMGLNKKIFTTSGYFPNDTFLNIINLACHQKKLIWSEKFIDEWSKFLNPNNSENVVKMGWARIYFEKKDFDAVIKSLRDIPFSNISYKLRSRILLAQSYYEHKEVVALFDFCKAMYLYIYRNKEIGNDMKSRADNFFKLLGRMANRHSKVKLIKELSDNKEVILCYDWLDSKIKIIK